MLRWGNTELEYKNRQRFMKIIESISVHCNFHKPLPVIIFSIYPSTKSLFDKYKMTSFLVIIPIKTLLSSTTGTKF